MIYDLNKAFTNTGVNPETLAKAGSAAFEQNFMTQSNNAEKNLSQLGSTWTNMNA
jgi:hypothetical protein